VEVKTVASVSSSTVNFVASGIPFLLTTMSKMYPAAQFHFHGELPHIDTIAKILLAIVDTTNVLSISESQ